jgi:hypothetical protein
MTLELLALVAATIVILVIRGARIGSVYSR